MANEQQLKVMTFLNYQFLCGQNIDDICFRQLIPQWSMWVLMKNLKLSEKEILNNVRTQKDLDTDSAF